MSSAIETVERLIALATSESAPEGEQTSAALQAVRLIRKHSLRILPAVIRPVGEPATKPAPGPTSIRKPTKVTGSYIRIFYAGVPCTRCNKDIKMGEVVFQEMGCFWHKDCYERPPTNG